MGAIVISLVVTNRSWTATDAPFSEPAGFDQWRIVDTRPLIDLAASPTGSTLLATTPRGDLLRYESEGQTTKIDTAPQLTDIDWADTQLAAAGEVSSEVWYAAAEDTVYSWADGGRTWQPIAET